MPRVPSGVFLEKSGLRPEGLHPARGVAASGFPPLRKIPNCCLPYEAGPCLSPSLAGHPLRPATDRRLGRPLPHQLANPPQAPPKASCDFEHRNGSVVTCGISESFDSLSPTSGQVTYVLLSRSPLAFPLAGIGPFDLHVLCTPPAFVLSQNQTLRQKIRPTFRSVCHASSSISNQQRPRCAFLPLFSC